MINRYPLSRKCRSISIGLVLFFGATNALAYRLEPQSGLKDIVCRNPFTAEYEAQVRTRRDEIAREMDGGPFHKALHLMTDLSAVDRPVIQSVDEIELTDTSAVISIEFGGQPYAFVLDKMVNPKDHILNLSQDKQQVSVTYCPLADSVRVVCDESESPIPLRVGGLDIGVQMVFLFEGIRYGQDSPDLPLADYPFARMSFGDWKSRYPLGQVCVPPALN